MPSNYTGNPIATQTPSPAPSLGDTTGGDPIGSLPVDGDPDSASTFLQAYKVALDWIAFLRRKLYALVLSIIGVMKWDAAVAYPEGSMVLDATGDGNTWRVKAGHTSTAGTHPSADLTTWERWGHTEADIVALLPVASGEVSDTGITVAGVGTLLTGSGLSTSVGTTTVIKRVSFCLAIGTTGTATVTLSGIKAFPASVKNIQASVRNGITLATDVVAGISSANVITIQATVGGGGGDVFVTLEGV